MQQQHEEKIEKIGNGGSQALWVDKEGKGGKDKHCLGEMTAPITFSKVLFFENQQPNVQEIGRKTQRGSGMANAANIFRVKAASSGTQRKDKLTYVRYQNYTSTRSRRTNQQKIFEINSFVKKLTQNLTPNSQIPEITQTKFKALKKIIQYYDIKNLDRSEYSNVIKSFGLQIGTMRGETKPPTQSLDKRNHVKKIRAMSLMNRTTKKMEVKEMDRTFDSSSFKDGITPPRQLISERSCKEQSKKEALSLFNSLQVRKDKLKATSPRKFKFSNGENVVIQKVNKYRQYIFMLNYSNHLYRPLDVQYYPVPLRFYVGRGNNGNLIRSLLKKRFWFQESHQKQAHFVWTQIKIPQIFKKQPSVLPDSQSISKTGRKQPLRVPGSKTEGISRIMINDEVRQIVTMQELIKARNIQSFQDRLKYCPRQLKKQPILMGQTVHNHFPGNGLLGNKKALFLCLRQYCRLTSTEVFDIVPLTFIINQGLHDPQLTEVINYFNQRKCKKRGNFWILKPGQFSNRGNGIECTNKLQDIKKRVSKCHKQNKKGSIIVQQYITRPLLYNGRKFDLRTYLLLTSHNSKTKAYWYQDGYVRTSSSFFNLDDVDPYIHLTNDAVQINAEGYSYYQEGNKLSFSELQRYLDGLPAMGRNLDIANGLVPKMKQIAATAIRSTWMALNSDFKDKNFQLFGLDFMIDENFKPWLIEVNTNPCLQLSSPVLQRLVPYMIENVLRMSLDTVFPPPDNFNNNYKYNIPQNSLHYNKFQLIFDSDRDGPALKSIYKDHSFFDHFNSLEQDKNQFKQEGEFINVQQL